MQRPRTLSRGQLLLLGLRYLSPRFPNARRLPGLVATPDTTQHRGLKKETPPALPYFGCRRRRSPSAGSGGISIRALLASDCDRRPAARKARALRVGKTFPHRSLRSLKTFPFRTWRSTGLMPAEIVVARKAKG
jgi:hypothetical protein